MWYSELENQRLWKIFNDLSSVPRESGNEKGIRKFLLAWASENGLEAKTDKTGNVVIYCPATPGCEDYPVIALQGHMDMVCVKTADSSHDFLKDPIDIYVDGEVIRARGTTLGADNGIAMATVLDIFSDKEAQHGPLEGIFTVSEETGMDGAFGLDASLVNARRLVNLDSEEEGIIYTGCAGGENVEASLKLKWTDPAGEAVKVTVSGLLGGHSGSEIHQERGNAIKILARYLKSMPLFQLAYISGGTRTNVIPSYAEAVITVPDTERAIAAGALLQDQLSNELKDSDPGVKLEVTEAKLPDEVLKRKLSYEIAEALYLAPHGVGCVNRAMDVVETSDNLAVVKMEEGRLKVVFSIRSTVESKKHLKTDEIVTLMEALGFKTRVTSGYPAWEPSTDPAFRDEVAEAYRTITGKEPKVMLMHAGLECGILNSIIPGMDSLSIGPELRDVHSVNENLNIASAERVSAFVKKMLVMLK